ncbi:hypothetical protein ACIBF7_15335 [Nonomuraea sp. NPDC050478]|uniref:hypothetical protein n=1 Tax=Nonomuraea sp. NPDC050478 TaxID=3364365 RepID=UPI0037AD8113
MPKVGAGEQPGDFVGSFHLVARGFGMGQSAAGVIDGAERGPRVDDAIAASIAAGTAHLPNSLINVGAGGTTSLNDIVDQARQITGWRCARHPCRLISRASAARMDANDQSLHRHDRAIKVDEHQPEPYTCWAKTVQ